MFTTVHQARDGRIFYKEGMSLVKAGYDLTIIGLHPREEVVQGIKILPLSPAKNRLIRLLRGIGVLFKAFKEKADFYHFHDPELIWVGLTLKMFTKARVIYDAHEYYAESILSKQWIPKKLRPLISKLANFLEKRSVRFFDGVVTATEMMEERFKKFSPRTVALNNYPVEEFFAYSPEDCLPRREKRIIYTGSINKLRGLEIIIRTIDLVRKAREDFQCLLVGKIDFTGVDSALIQLFNQLKDEGYLKVFGHLDYKELFSLLRQSQLAWNPILPAPHYCLAVPSKIYEYMAAGLPFITGDFGPTARLVRRYNCGCLVNPLNPQEHAEAILRLFNQENTAREIGKRGYNWARKFFSWAKEEKKLLLFYEEIGRKQRKG
jgi:glycosyltransferase involved in cell wall biosynthesis